MDLRTRDVARCAEISPYVVREYSDAGLIGPVPRSESNYRRIDMRAIPQVYFWRTLQKQGFTMKQLREHGQRRTPENTLDLFRQCDGQLEAEIAELRARQNMLRSYGALIEEGRAARPGEIEVRALPERPIRRVPLKDGAADRYERMRGAFEQVRRGGSESCPLGYAYHAFRDLLRWPEYPAQLVSYDPRGNDARPAGDYLVGTEQCPCDEIDALANRMSEYARKHNLAFSGPAYVVNLFDAVCVASPEQFLLQVTVQVGTA